MENEWKPDPSIQVVVVCAAIRRKSDGVILAGARHFDRVMTNVIRANSQGDELDRSWSDADQGFIDQFGRFLSRKEALEVVLNDPKQRSVMRNPNAGVELYSEDLY